MSRAESVTTKDTVVMWPLQGRDGGVAAASLPKVSRVCGAF